MTALMKQYGKTVIFALAAAAVLGIAFGIRINGHTGFIGAAYGRAMEDLDRSDVRISEDTDAVKAAAARKCPVILFRCETILPKVPVNLEEMLMAADADGNRLHAVITDMKTEDGKTLSDQTGECPDGLFSRFVFPSAGIYIMEVTASDRECKTVKARFRIPVTGI